MDRSDFQIAPTLRVYSMAVMAEKLWVLRFACAACRKGASWPGGELVARFGPAATVGEVLDRLVCACGSRAGAAMIVQSAGDLQARDVARFNASRKLGGPKT